MLDFSKPLRVVGSTGMVVCGAETLKEGLTLVRDEDGSIFVVDEMGVVQTTDRWKGDGGLRIENAPEEPKDNILVYRGSDGKWRVDGGGNYTKATAEKLSRSPFYRDGMVVKVPV